MSRRSCGVLMSSLRTQGRREQVSRCQGRNPVAPKEKKRLRKQRDATCPDLAVKIFLFSSPPNHRHIYRRLALEKEGRLAIVTDVGSGMRWTRLVRLTRC